MDCGWTLMFQGAEARVYSGLYEGKPAVKKERFQKRYRHPDLDTDLRKDRMRAEVRSLTRVRDRCPRLSHLMPAVLFEDKSSSVIIMDRVLDSESCVSAFEAEVKAGRSSDWLFIGIGETVADMHAISVAHGDLTPSNLLVKHNTVIPIDFGLSVSTESAEDRAVDLYVLERALISSHIPDQNFDAVLRSYRSRLAALNVDEKKVENVMRKLDEECLNDSLVERDLLEDQVKSMREDLENFHCQTKITSTKVTSRRIREDHDS